MKSNDVLLLQRKYENWGGEIQTFLREKDIWQNCYQTNDRNGLFLIIA